MWGPFPYYCHVLLRILMPRPFSLHARSRHLRASISHLAGRFHLHLNEFVMAVRVPSLSQAMRRFSRFSLLQGPETAPCKVLPSPSRQLSSSSSLTARPRRKPVSLQCLHQQSSRALSLSPLRLARTVEQAKVLNRTGVRIFLRGNYRLFLPLTSSYCSHSQ
jgi:hypothetical protein